eukprot:1776946-Ditylum_brightwellii.AAC.1
MLCAVGRCIGGVRIGAGRAAHIVKQCQVCLHRGATQTWLALVHVGDRGGALLAKWQSLFDSHAAVIRVVQ